MGSVQGCHGPCLWRISPSHGWNVPLATKALKKWAGLARSSNTSILFHPAKRGGLALPSLVRLYKNMHATKMVQLFRSSDPAVRKAADLHLSGEKERQRLKFRPAAPSYLKTIPRAAEPCQGLSRAVKTLVAEADDDERHQSLCYLPSQGEMARSWGDTSPELWARAVHATT